MTQYLDVTLIPRSGAGELAELSALLGDGICARLQALRAHLSLDAGYHSQYHYCETSYKLSGLLREH